MFWKIKSFLYLVFRNVFPFGRILEKENLSVREMIASVLRDGDAVLDAGCGDGNGARIVLSLERRVSILCLDSTDAMLSRAPRHASVYTKLAPADNTGLDDCSIDVILCIGVMEYVADPKAVLSEFLRVARPNAYLCITFSPPILFNHLRWIHGRRLFLHDTNRAIEMLSHSGWQVMKHSRKLIQTQFLAAKT